MLFDTDVLIWAARNHPAAVDLLSRERERSISVVTLMELFQGARNRAQNRTTRLFLDAYQFEVLPLTENIGSRAAVYVEEYGLAHGLQALDALIAATAAEQGRTLATANRRHFACIAGLRLKIFVP